MKYALIALALMLAACTELPADWTVTRQAPATYVTAWGRIWTVTPVPEKPGFYKAVRDDNDLDPFGPPAMPRTHQAMRAIRVATGCRTDYASMYQTISGAFFARVNCPRGT